MARKKEVTSDGRLEALILRLDRQTFIRMVMKAGLTPAESRELQAAFDAAKGGA